MTNAKIIDDRLLLDTPIGTLQAWVPFGDEEVGVALSWYAAFSHVYPETKSYILSSTYLSAADARALGAALIKAADYSDRRVAEAADLGIAT